MRRVVWVLTVLAVLGGGCSSRQGAADGSGATPATTTTPAATSSSSSSSSSSTTTPSTGRTAAAGIWLADLGTAHLQFRLESGPAGTLVGVFDSPDEGVTDIPLNASVDGDQVVLDIATIGAVFEATVTGERLEGVWQQSGVDIPLVFERRNEPFAYARPQEPKPPFPYTSTEVTFAGHDFELAGTLVVPSGGGPFPAVVLVSGSGPQDRDETLAGHKPFLVLADALARVGIASLRYDDRGVGGSGGDPTGTTTQELATDTAAAVRFLAGRAGVGSIGIVGHSEGGLIAPMVAVGSSEVDFIVLLAGPAQRGIDLARRQTEDLMRAEGVSESIVAWRMGWTDDVLEIAASDAPGDEVEAGLRTVLDTALTETPTGAGSLLGDIDQLVATFSDPWMRWFLAYDPAPMLGRVEVPVLALVGELDLQVSAGANLPALREALAGNPDATVIGLDGLNHLFQPAVTGSVSEYGRIEVTFDPATMDLIAGWILERF